MKLDISQALKSPGTSFAFTVSAELDPMSPGGENIRFTKPVDVTGTYVFTGEIFFLRGSILAEYTALCCRCVQEVHASMDIGFSEEFSREADESHPDRYLFRGETIELEQMVTDQLSLNTPMKHLCSENCQGLCPVCGADRNTVHCDCMGN